VELGNTPESLVKWDSSREYSTGSVEVYRIVRERKNER